MGVDPVALRQFRVRLSQFRKLHSDGVPRQQQIHHCFGVTGQQFHEVIDRIEVACFLERCYNRLTQLWHPITASSTHGQHDQLEGLTAQRDMQIAPRDLIIRPQGGWVDHELTPVMILMRNGLAVRSAPSHVDINSAR